MLSLKSSSGLESLETLFRDYDTLNNLNRNMIY